MNFRFLTLNIWGLPFGLASDLATRVDAIGEALFSTSCDIICLQEVWTKDDYRRLKKYLKKSHPFHHYFYSGLTGSGLCIFSKWQIEETFYYQYPMNGLFHMIHHGDWFGGKGVGLAIVNIKGIKIYVYNTHLHANYSNTPHIQDTYFVDRLIQSFDAALFVKHTSAKADLCIVGGDLNSTPNDLGVKLLKGLTDLEDSLEIAKIKEAVPETSDCKRNSYRQKNLPDNYHGLRIDYILFKAQDFLKKMSNTDNVLNESALNKVHEESTDLTCDNTGVGVNYPPLQYFDHNKYYNSGKSHIGDYINLYQSPILDKKDVFDHNYVSVKDKNSIKTEDNSAGHNSSSNQIVTIESQKTLPKDHEFNCLSCKYVEEDSNSTNCICNKEIKVHANYKDDEMEVGKEEELVGSYINYKHKDIEQASSSDENVILDINDTIGGNRAKMYTSSNNGIAAEMFSELNRFHDISDISKNFRHEVNNKLKSTTPENRTFTSMIMHEKEIIYKNENKTATSSINMKSDSLKRKQKITSIENLNVNRKKLKSFEPPKLKESNRDIFCWKCHKYAENSKHCRNCPRVFHVKCSTLPEEDIVKWLCDECVYIKTAVWVKKEHFSLSRLLMFVIKRIRTNDQSIFFETPVNSSLFPEYKDYIVNPMCITLLESNVCNDVYSSCESFLSDVKWMVHNSYIFNSPSSKLTTSVRSMLRSAINECNEITLCGECYLHANELERDLWFIEPCSDPHLLIWAKLQGFPFWPGKVMAVTQQGVNVRFFGDHNKSVIPVESCYLYSKRIPAKIKVPPALAVAIQEVQLHIKKLESKFFQFCYAPFKTLLNPDDFLSQKNILFPLLFKLSFPHAESMQPISEDTKELHSFIPHSQSVPFRNKSQFLISQNLRKTNPPKKTNDVTSCSYEYTWINDVKLQTNRSLVHPLGKRKTSEVHVNLPVDHKSVKSVLFTNKSKQVNGVTSRNDFPHFQGVTLQKVIHKDNLALTKYETYSKHNRIDQTSGTIKKNIYIKKVDLPSMKLLTKSFDFPSGPNFYPKQSNIKNPVDSSLSPGITSVRKLNIDQTKNNYSCQSDKKSIIINRIKPVKSKFSISEHIRHDLNDKVIQIKPTEKKKKTNENIYPSNPCTLPPRGISSIPTQNITFPLYKGSQISLTRGSQRINKKLCIKTPPTAIESFSSSLPKCNAILPRTKENQMTSKNRCQASPRLPTLIKDVHSLVSRRFQERNIHFSNDEVSQITPSRENKQTYNLPQAELSNMKMPILLTSQNKMKSLQISDLKNKSPQSYKIIRCNQAVSPTVVENSPNPQKIKIGIRKAITPDTTTEAQGLNIDKIAVVTKPFYKQSIFQSSKLVKEKENPDKSNQINAILNEVSSIDLCRDSYSNELLIDSSEDMDQVRCLTKLYNLDTLIPPPKRLNSNQPKQDSDLPIDVALENTISYSDRVSQLLDMQNRLANALSYESHDNTSSNFRKPPNKNEIEDVFYNYMMLQDESYDKFENVLVLAKMSVSCKVCPNNAVRYCCTGTYYCSVVCQDSNWRTHQKICRQNCMSILDKHLSFNPKLRKTLKNFDMVSEMLPYGYLERIVTRVMDKNNRQEKHDSSDITSMDISPSSTIIDNNTIDPKTQNFSYNDNVKNTLLPYFQKNNSDICHGICQINTKKWSKNSKRAAQDVKPGVSKVTKCLTKTAGCATSANSDCFPLTSEISSSSSSSKVTSIETGEVSYKSIEDALNSHCLRGRSVPMSFEPPSSSNSSFNSKAKLPFSTSKNANITGKKLVSVLKKEYQNYGEKNVISFGSTAPAGSFKYQL